MFYATEESYACSVLINIDRLRNLFNTRHRIIVVVKPSLPSEYLKAFTAQNATVIPYDPPPIREQYAYYTDVLLKLVSFRLHQYIPSLKRIVVLDSDQLILQSLDNLFLLPEVDVAAPRMYWGSDAAQLTSALMVISLSDRLWDTVKKAMDEVDGYRFDMDIINDLFRHKALVLPGDYCTLNSLWETNELPNWWQGIEPPRDPDWKPTTTPPTPRPAKTSFSKHKTKNQTIDDEDSGSIREGEKQAVDDKKSGLIKRETTLDTELSNESAPQSPISGGPQRFGDNQDTLDKDVAETRVATEDDLKVSASDSTPLFADVEDKAYKDVPNSASPNKDIVELSVPRIPTLSPEEEYKAYKDALWNEEMRERAPRVKEILDRIYQEDVKVLHYTAFGKPWTSMVRAVKEGRPYAHHLLAEQMATWREKAREMCPGFELMEA